ncbi:unnamed protein product [Trichobilharzia regenti]|nr:unnamed protein product [Trichobilharzia regenti]
MTRLNLVMEYVAGGDLNRRILKYGKLSEAEGRIVFAQLVAAVNHLVSCFKTILCLSMSTILFNSSI